MGLAWLALLVIPLGHQVRSHRVHLRLCRAFRPGQPVPPTSHERNHAARPAALRAAADLSWLLFIALVVAITLVAAR